MFYLLERGERFGNGRAKKNVHSIIQCFPIQGFKVIKKNVKQEISSLIEFLFADFQHQLRCKYDTEKRPVTVMNATGKW